uniref:Uncharacterized protein n=1 Tax=Knipowitschia caucasica TaxID=637954 RepID=A0AAV2MKQ5_KNICA
MPYLGGGGGGGGGGGEAFMLGCHFFSKKSGIYLSKRASSYADSRTKRRGREGITREIGGMRPHQTGHWLPKVMPHLRSETSEGHTAAPPARTPLVTPRTPCVFEKIAYIWSRPNPDSCNIC